MSVKMRGREGVMAKIREARGTREQRSIINSEFRIPNF
jgi:hypothetical protein